jgi:hypothetical protein
LVTSHLDRFSRLDHLLVNGNDLVVSARDQYGLAWRSVCGFGRQLPDRLVDEVELGQDLADQQRCRAP